MNGTSLVLLFAAIFAAIITTEALPVHPKLAETLAASSPKDLNNIASLFENSNPLRPVASSPPSSVNNNNKPFTLDKRGFNAAQQLRPFVIVPSLLGNSLEARLHNAVSDHWYCLSNYDEWFRIHVDFDEMLPLIINCWFERMSLRYDVSERRAYNATGVEIRVPHYGGVDAVTYLDTGNTLGLWNDTVNVLTELGYVVGKNLRSAPYDWRISPLEYNNYEYPLLKALIEDTYAINNNTSVVLSTESMGAPYLLAFFNTYVSQEWKTKYVYSWVSFDGAFGGSTSALSSLLNPGSIFTKINSLFAEYGKPWLDLMRSWPSMTFVLPLIQIYGEDTVFVTTGTRNYTLGQLTDLLRDAGANMSARMWQDVTAAGYHKQQAPGVPIHCVFGHDVPTPFVLNYPRGDFSQVPTYTLTDGDGTVMREGLDQCKYWAKQQSQPTFTLPIKGMAHGNSLHTPECLAYLVQVLLS